VGNEKDRVAAGKELASYYISKGISSSRNERQRKEGIGIGTALPCLAPFLRLLSCMDSYQALPLDFPSGRLRALSSIKVLNSSMADPPLWKVRHSACGSNWVNIER